MKLIALVSLVTALTAPLTASAKTVSGPKPFQCINIAYRESKVELATNHLLTVEDTFFQDSLDPLTRAFEKLEGLPANSLYVMKASLTLPIEDLNCTTVGALPLDCTGKSEDAVLRLVTMKDNDPAVATITYEARVPAVSVQLKGILKNSGPITLGSGVTSVALNVYAVQFKADLQIGKETVPFADATSFHVDPSRKKPSTSNCWF